MSTHTITLSETQVQTIRNQVALISANINAGNNVTAHINRLEMMVQRFTTIDVTEPLLFFTIK